ncbi:hypothetical protein [Micromonospora sp. NPDC092111]|uniref:hypothetical protein n=1 Tax=Micromonospora sp. NPDC092111 TaxID=3364289 RepID=UPI003812CA18
MLNPPYEVLRSRVAARNGVPDSGSFPISEAELAEWVGRFEEPTAQELALFDAHTPRER